jgi:hypothetical protein
MEYTIITPADITAQRTNRLRQAELAHASACDEIKLAKRIGAGPEVIDQLEREAMAWQVQIESLREWMTDDQ